MRSLGAMLDKQKTPKWVRDQIVQSYLHPKTIDLYKVPWIVLSRPSPFVGSAPQPGAHLGDQCNAWQMRDDREIKPSEKPKGVFRIFITGGSFAFGSGAPDSKASIARSLENRLNRAYAGTGTTFEVWNAAQPAWSSTHERALIETRLWRFGADLVIMLTGTNDAHWGYEGRDALDMRTYADEEYLALINEARQMDGFDPYPFYPPYYNGMTHVDKWTVADRFKHNVRLAAQALLPSDTPLLVVMQPFLAPDAKTLTDAERRWCESPGRDHAEKVAYFKECFDTMCYSVTGLMALKRTRPDLSPGNLHLVSLRKAFADRSDPIFIDMYHVADKGNAIFAEKLEYILNSKHLLPALPKPLPRTVSSS